MEISYCRVDSQFEGNYLLVSCGDNLSTEHLSLNVCIFIALLYFILRLPIQTMYDVLFSTLASDIRQSPEIQSLKIQDFCKSSIFFSKIQDFPQQFKIFLENSIFLSKTQDISQKIHDSSLKSNISLKFQETHHTSSNQSKILIFEDVLVVCTVYF